MLIDIITVIDNDRINFFCAIFFILKNEPHALSRET